MPRESVFRTDEASRLQGISGSESQTPGSNVSTTPPHPEFFRVHGEAASVQDAFPATSRASTTPGTPDTTNPGNSFSMATTISYLALVPSAATLLVTIYLAARVKSIHYLQQQPVVE